LAELPFVVIDLSGTMLSRRGIVGAALLAAGLAGVGAAPALEAQRMRGMFGGVSNPPYEGRFTFCRLMFRSAADADGGSWSVDYPRADINFPFRLGQYTLTPINRDSRGEPNHLLLAPTDDRLFECPFVMMTEVGSAAFTADEAARLRMYLDKGGFLWADDFWGEYAWYVWARAIGQVLPPAQFPIVDLPLSHPIFHSFFEVDEVPQIPSIDFLFRSGGQTSERGADSAEPHARAIMDENGRIMVFMTHNTDIGDSWEREGDNREYFDRFATDGYAFGINVFIHAITH
jgi:hypothetical protein